jgi:hypothetical protein
VKKVIRKYFLQGRFFAQTRKLIIHRKFTINFPTKQPLLEGKGQNRLASSSGIVSSLLHSREVGARGTLNGGSAPIESKSIFRQPEYERYFYVYHT